ncbi:MAG: hypothetical protein N2109_06070 [Fimbriimonadales bacterium]|nr:hypothetical protein [Fimbriimonadales bacterium]
MPRKKLKTDEPSSEQEPTQAETTAEPTESEPTSLIEIIKEKVKRVRRRTKKSDPEAVQERDDAPEAEVAANREAQQVEPVPVDALSSPEPEQTQAIQERPKRARRRGPKAPREGASAASAPAAVPVASVPEGGAGAATEASEHPSPAEETVGAQQVAPDLVALLLDGETFPNITWRQPRRTEKVATPTPPVPESKQAPRRSRRQRNNGEASEKPITALDALQPQPKPRARERKPHKATEPQTVAPAKPEPLIPPRPPIPTPPQAPQIVTKDGNPMLVVGGRAVPPIVFFGQAADERKARNVFEEIAMAGEAGIHLHSLLVEFAPDPTAVEDAVRMAAFLLKKTLEADPEARVLFRVLFVAPHGWQEKFPDARYSLQNGKLAEPSVCDDAYWSMVKDCLAEFVRSLRALPTADRILGLHLDRGEWFNPSGAGYDCSNAARNLFRRWAQKRYLGDVVALRAAWFDGRVDFENLDVPPYQPPTPHRDKFVRSDRKDRRWVDYHLFLSDATAARLADLAYAVKEASEGWFLVGVSYGYTFEWSHADSGHLSLGKILRTREIDYIAGPPSYRNRGPGGSAPFPCPIDSFNLNGKLFLSEEDYRTSLGEPSDPDDFNPVIRTPQALEAVHWRGAGAALCHSHGVCWMDLRGNGWLKTASVWQRARRFRDCLQLGMVAPVSEPEVAVFIDERALAYLVDARAFEVLVQNVREAVLRSGLSVGFYLLSDLAHRESFPESKLYIFLNAWDIRQELRSAIKQRLQRDDKVLFWLYVAGLFESGRDSLDRAREVTGIALRPQPFSSRTGTTVNPTFKRNPLCQAFAASEQSAHTLLEPSYCGIAEDAIELGEYTQTGLASFLLKEFGKDREPSQRWKSVFLGEPIVTPGLVRALGQLAGAHVWSFQDDVIHVRPPFLMVHCSGTGARTLAMPGRWGVYNLLAREWVAEETTSLRFYGQDGSSHLFLIGPKTEIEHLLNTDFDQALAFPEIPPRDENTIQIDAADFDVPIVKFLDWMEGANADDFAEDLLLRFRSVEESEEPDQPEPPAPTPGSKRRRRRKSSQERKLATEETQTREAPDLLDPDGTLGLNVIFRHRE